MGNEDNIGGIILQNNVGERHKAEVERILTDEEKFRIEHEKLHAAHRGHEAMHMEMFLILIITLIVAQIFLVTWKRKHFKSYQLVTLLGMWIIPVYFCLDRGWWRFLFTWLCFTIISTLVWLKASAAHITGTTPRIVYKWFLFLHNLSYALGVIGYIVMMLTLLGFNLIFGLQASTCMDTGVLLLFYGLYYGVLGRDLAHICTDRMACRIGYYTVDGLPKKHLEDGVCAVCDLPLGPERRSYDDEGVGADEQTYKLSCGHVFHEFCIRGWVVVGKQQTCPYCKEKVDLKRMFKNPWEKPHLFYGKLLDWIRYLVCWQPVIITFVQGLNHWLGLE